MNVAGLTAWLARERPALFTGDDLVVERISGGRSNLTYRVRGASMPLILRRPPLGHVLASAHDMGREFRVIAALRDTAVPVPDAVAVVDDTDASDVTGTPFFVMELAPGRPLAHPADNAGITPAGAHALGIELATTLADLHAVDPDAVGLADFGRPAGYLTRQMATWRRQLAASRSRDLPGLDRLADRLDEDVPESGVGAIVHGDYRLDNALVIGEGDVPHISALLDWEMATLGDSLVDLGVLSIYWTLSDIPGATRAIPTAVDPAAGYPDVAELFDAYAERRGAALPDLAWYRAFAAFKLAVISEWIYYRYQHGQTVGDGFEAFGDIVPGLVDAGEHLIAGARGPGRSPRHTEES